MTGAWPVVGLVFLMVAGPLLSAVVWAAVNAGTEVEVTVASPLMQAAAAHAAALSAALDDLDVADEGDVCESCRRLPVAQVVVLDGVAFRLCSGCAPAVESFGGAA